MYLCYSHQDFSTLPFFRSIFFYNRCPESIQDQWSVEDPIFNLRRIQYWRLFTHPSPKHHGTSLFDPRYTLFFIWSAHWNASVRQYVSQGLLNWPGCTDSHLQKKGLCDGSVYVCRMKALVLKMQEGVLAVKLL